MMTRDTLDRIIDGLKDEILALESIVRQATVNAVYALVNDDQAVAREVYHGDRVVNEKRFEIETGCITAIATQQPLAVDLRILASILEIVTELERMGDYAKGIARICLISEEKRLLDEVAPLKDMVSVAAGMLVRSIRAFVDSNIEEARAIPKLDDQVDAYHNQISQALIERVIREPEQAKSANYLQWAVHNIERMADRVTNICERTVYVVTGVMNEFENSDDEFPALE